MLSHVSLGTNDAGRAAQFYDPVLAVLGIRKICERDGSVDYGVSKTIFSLERPSDGRPASVGYGVHIAFDAGNEFRYARMRLMNATGPTTVDIPVTLRAEYYQNAAAGFVLVHPRSPLDV